MSENPSEDIDDCFLNFNLFGDLLDDIEHNDVGIIKKEVTKKDIDKLVALIGGFEKWSILIEDCRKEVVKYLDYKTRFSLGVCSKQDYATVENTPMYVYSVEMEDGEKHHYSFSKEEFDNVIVRLQFHHDYNSGKRFELIFSQLGEDTQIQWLHYFPKKRPEKKQVIRKSCNYYEEAVKFAEKWMKKCNYELEEIKVEMAKYPFESSRINFLPRCTKVRIGADDMESFKWWFGKVPEQLLALELLTDFAQRDTFTLPSEFLNAPQVMQVPKFYFWCRAAFSDEQFLNLKAKSMNFDCVTVTDDGINKFIKNWINGKGPKDFKSALLWSETTRDQAALTRGLHLRPWDSDFEQEARGFCSDFDRCCGRGTCFQIQSRVDPYESITLSISGDRISIYGTGKRVEWNGETYTDYSIP